MQVSDHMKLLGSPGAVEANKFFIYWAITNYNSHTLFKKKGLNLSYK